MKLGILMVLLSACTTSSGDLRKKIPKIEYITNKSRSKASDCIASGWLEHRSNVNVVNFEEATLITQGAESGAFAQAEVRSINEGAKVLYRAMSGASLMSFLEDTVNHCR